MDNTINSAITIYPNPANDIVTITGLQAQSTLTLYDQLGTRVREVINKIARIEISLKDLNSGNYILHIWHLNGTQKVEQLTIIK